MEDIARECGVSIMTVSRVLNGKDCVKASTRAKILQSAERLNFEINTMARNFAQKRSGFVGVAFPFERLIGTNYLGEIFKGFQRAFGNTPWNLSMFDVYSPAFDSGRKLEKLFRSRRVDGLLIVAPNANETFFDTLTAAGMPLVVVGKSVNNTKVCSVSCDDYRGVQMNCAHLYELGHRRIAFVGGPEDFSVAQWRESAYLDFCREKGLDLPPHFLQRGNYSTESGRQAGLTLLGSGDRPTAIVAANDMMAFGVMESARRMNVSIPDELSVAGFDDLPAANEWFASMTTVHQPLFEMGQQGAEILLGSLNGGPAPHGRTVLPVSFISRTSTGPASSH